MAKKDSIKLSRRALMKALDPILAVQSAKGPSVIYSTVKLTTSADKMRLLGFGQSSFVETEVSIDGVSMPEIHVNSTDLRNAVHAMAADDLDLSLTTNNRLTVKGNITARVETLGDVVLPELPTIPTTDIDVDGGALLAAIDRVLPAMCQDFTRPHVNAIFLSGGNAIATDGHRLHVSATPLAEDVTVLVPAPFVAAVSKLTPGPWALGYDQHRVAVRSGDQLLCMALPDAQFPPYQQVIPRGRKNACVARVPRASAIETIRSAINASKAKEEKDYGLRLRVSGETMTMRDKSEHIDATVALVCADGEVDEAIGANPVYIVQALAMFDGDNVDVEFGGPLDPILVKSGAADDEDCAVLMPMRV